MNYYQSREHVLVDILNLIGSGAGEHVQLILAHDANLCLGIGQSIGMGLALNPLNSTFRVQQLYVGVCLVRRNGDLVSINLYIRKI